MALCSVPKCLSISFIQALILLAGSTGLCLSGRTRRVLGLALTTFLSSTTNITRPQRKRKRYLYVCTPYVCRCPWVPTSLLRVPLMPKECRRNQQCDEKMKYIWQRHTTDHIQFYADGGDQVTGHFRGPEIAMTSTELGRIV